MYIIAQVEDNFLTEAIFKGIGVVTPNWLFYSVLVVVLILSIKGISSCCSNKKRRTKVIVHNGVIPSESIADDEEVVNMDSDD